MGVRSPSNWKFNRLHIGRIPSIQDLHGFLRDKNTGEGAINCLEYSGTLLGDQGSSVTSARAMLSKESGSAGAGCSLAAMYSYLRKPSA